MLALWEEVSLGLLGRGVGEGRQDSQGLWRSASILSPVLTEVLRKAAVLFTWLWSPQGGERLRGKTSLVAQTHVVAGMRERDGLPSSGSLPLQEDLPQG